MMMQIDDGWWIVDDIMTLTIDDDEDAITMTMLIMEDDGNMSVGYVWPGPTPCTQQNRAVADNDALCGIACAQELPPAMVSHPNDFWIMLDPY